MNLTTFGKEFRAFDNTSGAFNKRLVKGHHSINGMFTILI